MSDTVPCKKHSPGSSSLGYVWETTDDVVEIHKDHLATVINASHGDIYEAVQDALEAEDTDPLALSTEGDEPQGSTSPEFTDPGDLAQALSAASAVAEQPKPKATRTPRKAAAKPQPTE